MFCICHIIKSSIFLGVVGWIIAAPNNIVKVTATTRGLLKRDASTRRFFTFYFLFFYYYIIKLLFYNL